MLNEGHRVYWSGSLGGKVIPTNANVWILTNKLYKWFFSTASSSNRSRYYLIDFEIKCYGIFLL